MGKFAGFLKRAKKIAGIGMNVLNSFNDIYKGIKPFAEPIVGALPFGNYINKGLDAASTVIDKVQPFTNIVLGKMGGDGKMGGRCKNR